MFDRAHGIWMPVLAVAFALSAFPVAAKPLSLHPENPHYFLFRNKPTVLVTSGEHYGAVLNLDFNYVKYLDTLQADGLNLTRTFSGSYLEPSGAFNISGNSLAPVKNRFICPWARSAEPGYPNGGNKFDLTKWDEAYFKRLKDFLTQAALRGVIVEMNLFCPFYDESQWKISPQNAANNINGVGNVARTNAYTLDKNGGLLAVQETMVRKLVIELNGFDNLYYEICNEPYFGGVTIEWQHHIADVIVAAEKSLPNQHLISQNIANGKAKIQNPHPAVSIFNFHYASPPDTVGMNYPLNKVIGDNETGFKGTNDTHYRMEAWEFMLAGGGLYNDLDYSFSPGFENGTYSYPAKQPGGGNTAFRAQMKVLRQFLNSFEFIKMKPDKNLAMAAEAQKAHATVLAEADKQYAVYLFGGPVTVLTLEVPAGQYRADWINPLTGKIEKSEEVNFGIPLLRLKVPPYQQDIALRLLKR